MLNRVYNTHKQHIHQLRQDAKSLIKRLTSCMVYDFHIQLQILNQRKTHPKMGYGFSKIRI